MLLLLFFSTLSTILCYSQKPLLFAVFNCMYAVDWIRRAQRNVKSPGGMCWRHAHIHCVALLCFYTHQRSSHSPVSGIQLSMEITHHFLLSLPAVAPPPQTSLSVATKTSSEVCWDHRHHFIYDTEKNLQYKYCTEFPWLVFQFNFSIANPILWVPFLLFL